MSSEQKHKDKIIGILSVLFPKAKIYLFGSRARGTHRDASDIDIAIDAGSKLSFSQVGEASDTLNALNIPYKMDVVDMHLIPEDMKKMILQDGILWKK